MRQDEKAKRKADAMEEEAEKRQKSISPDEAKKRLRKYGWCRGITHFWEQAGPVLRVETDIYELQLICAHCTAKRITRLTSSGAIVGNHHNYRHPKDYSTPGHLTTRSEVRRLVFLEKLERRK